MVSPMHRVALQKSMLDLVHRTCTELPEDVFRAIETAYQHEEHGSVAQQTLFIIRQSAQSSAQERLPLCQDTGAVFAIIKAKPNKELFAINEAIKEAIRSLTREGTLRQNCVDPLTERNTGNNIGDHAPVIHTHPWDGPAQVFMMLKGGGSENISTQYSLPNEGLCAGRDLDGARRCMLDAVFQAQGKGCAPGILGVCIGGDRTSGYIQAKEQLFRKLNDKNPSAQLARLEDVVYAEANMLGIGPMGLGGKATLLGVKISPAARHPACYYVTVSYSCWATRRYAVELDENGRIARWL